MDPTPMPRRSAFDPKARWCEEHIAVHPCPFCPAVQPKPTISTKPASDGHPTDQPRDTRGRFARKT
jgi:hypothetical protein